MNSLLERPYKEGWILSLALHFLLLILFLMLKLDLKPFELNYTLLEFSSVSEASMKVAAEGSGTSVHLPPVELPRKEELQEIIPLLRTPPSQKRTVDVNIPAERMVIPQFPEMTPDWHSVGKESERLTWDNPPIEPLSTTEEWLSQEREQQILKQVVGDDMFAISWEGPMRIKVSGELPVFPPGIRRDAVIRLSFTVSPDGVVKSIIPSTKGVPELEKVSIEAFRHWRFNRLDPSLPQIDQSGEITFRFRLK
ncbi:MAG: hypothetical protein ACK4OO_05325 [bacterium]